MDFAVLIGQLIGTLIGAGIGAYIAGRWTEKGRISAVTSALSKVVEQETARASAQEQGRQDALITNLHNLDTQMRTLTTTQEQIKAQISGELWDRQMHWTQKKDLYGQLVRNVTELQDCYNALRAALRLNRADVVPENLREVNEAYRDFSELWALARIFASPACETAIQNFIAGRQKPENAATEEHVERELAGCGNSMLGREAASSDRHLRVI